MSLHSASKDMVFDPLFSEVPRIEYAEFSPNDLLIGPLIEAYEEAKDNENKEDATSALFGMIFNGWLSCRKLSVSTQRKIDQSNQAPDLCVRYWDSSQYGRIESLFVLIAEFKRARHTNLPDLERELKRSTEDYLRKDLGGKGRHPVVFGAAAFGARIRFFECYYDNELQHRMVPFSGEEGFNNTKKEDYWDLKVDGAKIHRALKRIWGSIVAAC